MRVNRVSMRYFKYASLVAAVAVVLMIALSGCQAPVNQPPTVTLSLSNGEVEPEAEVTASIIANDPEKGPLTYSLRVGATEVASGTIPVDKLGKAVEVPFNAPNTEGSYSVTVIVTDEGGLTASDSKTLTVKKPNTAPEIEEASLDRSTATLSADESSTDVTLTFKAVDKESSTLSYAVKLNGAEVDTGSVASGEEKSVSITVTQLGKNYINLKVSDGALSAEKTMVFELYKKGKVTIYNTSGYDIIGNKHDSITFKIWYQSSGGTTPKDMYWAIKDESGTEVATGTVDYSANFVDNVYDGFQVASSTLAGLPAGKYSLCVKLLDAVGNVIENTQAAYSPIYYYPEISLSVSLVPDSTNNDYDSDVYDGNTPIGFKVVINGNATTTLFKGVSFELGSKAYTIDWAFTSDSTVEELSDGIYYVELPATITFDVTVGATEIAAPSAVATATLADESAEDDSTTLNNIDGLNPVVSFNPEIISNDTIRLGYALSDSNFKAATITFYDEAGEEVASATFNSAGSGFENLVISKKVDKTSLTYSYEAEDSLEHSTSGSSPVEGYIDTAVGSATVAWENSSWIEKDGIRFYKAASALTFDIKVLDKAGVYADGINVDLSSLSGVTASTSVSLDSELVYTWVLSFGSPAEVEIPASSIKITISDIHGNSYINNITTDGVLKAASDQIFFPQATVVYDTQAPVINSATFTSDGQVTLGITENYLDTITVYASDSSAATKLADIPEASWTVSGSYYSFTVTDEMYENAGLSVPNGETASLKFVATDKAGNVSAAASVTGTLDLVPPALAENLVDTYITRTSSVVTIHMQTDSNTSKITDMTLTGADIAGIVAEVEYTDGSTQDFLGSDAVSNNLIMDITDATEATLSITFANGATIQNASTLELKVYASDQTYDHRLVGDATIDYSDVLFSQSRDLDVKAVVYNGDHNYLVFSDTSAGLTFVDFVGATAGATNNSYGDGIYVLKSDPEATVSVDTTTGEASVVGSAKYALSWGDDATWYVIGSVDLEDLSAVSLDSYVGDIFTSDNITENSAAVKQYGDLYFWNLADATQIVLQLPVKDGLYWDISSLATDTYANARLAVSSDATDATVTFDYEGITFNSDAYGALVNEASVDAYMAGDSASTVEFSLLNIYAKDLMDEYTPEVLGLEATEDTAKATVVLTVKFNSLTDVTNILLDASMAGVDYATDTNTVSNISGANITLSSIASDTNIATVTFGIDLSAEGVTGDTGSAIATLTIAQDELMFKWNRDGANFWVTNFGGGVTVDDDNLNN